jgi:hypothetical protein
VTAEAVKFCVDHDIALASVASRTSQGEKGLISIVGSNPRAAAALLKAQVRAKGAIIAREIVRQKIETCASLGCLRADDARRFLDALQKARDLKRILFVEAEAASAY